MQAIIETGGKQFRVTPGDVIRVERLQGEAGSEIEFAPLVVFGDEGNLITGAALSQARVKGTIVGEGRGDKVIVFKFKRKKQYKRTIGHRQAYTEVRVSDILM